MIIQQIEEIPGQSNPLNEPDVQPEETKKKFDLSIITAPQLAQLEIKSRKCLVGKWFREGDLGYIYGKRGLGKTWFALYLAGCISDGKDFGNWSINKARVLYVDGEMPLEAVKQRSIGLEAEKTTDLLFLNHETFFDATEQQLSLSDPLQQQWIIDYCEQKKIGVLFLDNLSVLFSGMRENDADDWEKVMPWLLQFRRKKIAVVIIAHAGRSGNHMRGTSRREDAAFWTIGLGDSVKGREERKEGARFLTRFTKDRNSVNGDETGPLDWHFRELPTGKIEVKAYPADNMTIVLQLIEDGLESCTDISQDTGLSKGAISKIAKKLDGRGEITISAGGKYQIKKGKH